MSITPKRTLSYFLCFIGITFLLNLACSKDVESLREVVISKPTSPVVGQGESTDNQNKGLMEEVPQAGDSIVVETEIRTSVLYPINDAYLQNGKGYDEAIIRLEEEQRTSYLMFDFSPIDSIGGSITTATLMFVINTDDGSGEVEVYKGKSSDWSEENLNEKSAPDVGELVGATKQEYRINAEISIDLKVEELELEPSTFILDHKNGDDLAFASKEHESEVGSSLVVVYEVVAGSEDIASYLTQPKVIDRDSVNNEEEDVDVIEEEETDSEEEALVKEQVEEKKTDEEGEPEEGPVEEEATDSEENTTKSEEVEEENADGDEKKPEDEPDEAAADEQETGSEEDVPAEVKEESTDSTENEPEEKNNTDSIIDVLPNTPFPKNESPVAVVSGSPINGEAPLKVSFSAADSSDDKAIVSYLWDFKDGETASTVDVQHTFVKTGKYEVALVTKDEEGISASDIIIITVDEPGNNAPTAKLSVDKTSGTLPLSVNFTGSESTDDTSVSKYS
ncbi:PKD domain-containing protein, partial [Zobellia roscoffensis]